MRALICAVSALISSSATRASAEPASALELDVVAHAGVATAPFVTPELPEAKGRGGVLVFGGFFRATNGWGAALYVPATVVRLREPAGTSIDEPSWGNPIFWGERRFELPRGSFESVRGFVRAGIGAPLADMGPRGSLSKNRALAVADALEGLRDRELFTPGVLPFALATGVVLDGGAFGIEGSVKLVPMVRIDDAFLPRAVRKDAALVAVATAGGSVWPFPVLGFGALASLSTDAAPTVELPRARTLQAVLSPAIIARAGSRARLATEFVVPVGGVLGGNAVAVGFRAAVEW